MRIYNLNGAPNQFVINEDFCKIFQSYETVVAKIDCYGITLTPGALNFSKTTSKYLCMFLGLNRKEIEKRIKAGEIIVQELNTKIY